MDCHYCSQAGSGVKIMQRYFLENQYFKSGSVSFDEETAKHISKVMRMKPGAEIVVCNKEAGGCYLAELSQEDPPLASIIRKEAKDPELPVNVTIAQGLPKADKLEHIIQKGTELGAAEFLPFAAERSIVKLDSSKGGKKAVRWRKIAKEASEQSHRRIIPYISEPVNFKELLQHSLNFDHLLVAYEEQAKQGESSLFKQTLETMKAGEKVLIIIGPEGGLSEKEVLLLKEHQAVLCSFGPRILRTETAPLYALSVLSYYFELSG